MLHYIIDILNIYAATAMLTSLLNIWYGKLPYALNHINHIQHSADNKDLIKSENEIYLWGKNKRVRS